RIPAACCGIAGLKTSRGRVSKIGVFPLAPELDTVGPLARDVTGLVTAMRLLEPSFGSATGAPNGMRRRVVRLRLGDLAVDPAVDAAVDAALDAAGWRVRELAVAGWREAAWESSRILGAGAGKAHAHLLERPELLSAQARGYIENGVSQSPERVSRARMLLADLGRTLAAALTDDDAIVLPTLAGPPPLLLEDRSELDLTWLTVPFNVLGWPAVSVPTVAAVVGAPVPASLQLVGLPRSEEHLLAAAAQLPSQLPA
ncbi:MAG: amidase family protein, partial [Actinomycetes bacterium]